MPDISMCTNKKCTLKVSCYRFNAIPKKPSRQVRGLIRRESNFQPQTYALFQQDEKGECDFYWKMDAEEKRKVREGKIYDSPECEFCGETDPAKCPHRAEDVTPEETEMCDICEETREKSFICESCSDGKMIDICLNCCRHAVEVSDAA